jgi:hypothetical protein
MAAPTPAPAAATRLERVFTVSGCLAMFLVLLLLIVYGVWYLCAGSGPGLLRWTIVGLSLAVCLCVVVSSLLDWMKGRPDWKDQLGAVWGFAFLAAVFASSGAGKDKPVESTRPRTAAERLDDHERRIKDLERQLDELRQRKE